MFDVEIAKRFRVLQRLGYNRSSDDVAEISRRFAESRDVRFYASLWRNDDVLLLVVTGNVSDWHRQRDALSEGYAFVALSGHENELIFDEVPFYVDDAGHLIFRT